MQKSNGCAVASAITGIGFAVTLLLALAMRQPDPERRVSRTAPVSAATKPERSSQPRSVSDLTALEKMEVAFVGGHSLADIRSQMNRAFRLYGISATEDSYNRYGSVLVALRRDNSVPEMAILRCVIEAHEPGIAVDFPSMAAICVTTLAR